MENQKIEESNYVEMEEHECKEEFSSFLRVVLFQKSKKNPEGPLIEMETRGKMIRSLPLEEQKAKMSNMRRQPYVRLEIWFTECKYCEEYNKANGIIDKNPLIVEGYLIGNITLIE